MVPDRRLRVPRSPPTDHSFRSTTYDILNPALSSRSPIRAQSPDCSPTVHRPPSPVPWSGIEHFPGSWAIRSGPVADGPAWARRRSSSRCGVAEEIKLSRKLYVGNLSFTTTEGELKETFEKHGALASVKVITDRDTGRSRGFAFVEFEDAACARSAQEALDGEHVGGRELRVNEAHQKKGER